MSAIPKTPNQGSNRESKRSLEFDQDSCQAMFDNRVDDGVFRVDRSIYTDPDLFDAEMERIFEGTWIFVAHESQFPNTGDYVTTRMGRQPVIISRNNEGHIRGFVNACAHRGASLCHRQTGNLKFFVCGYHGWSYDLDGTLRYVFRENDGYREPLDREDFSLTPVPRIESYRGFVFASLNPDVLELKDHLQGAAKMIDMVVDQSDHGFEVVRGNSTCFYRGNWKLLVENGGADMLHPDFVHATLGEIAARKQRDGAEVHTMQFDSIQDLPGSSYGLGNGHTASWYAFQNPEDRPIYAHRQDLENQFGEDYARWIWGNFRVMTTYPNMNLIDHVAACLRHIKPVATDLTEVTMYCIVPKDATPEERIYRLRQFEEFYTVSGLGAPDDHAMFDQCQEAAHGYSARYNDNSYGLFDRLSEPDMEASKIGLNVAHGNRVGYEGTTIEQYNAWLTLMTNGAETLY